MSTVRMNSSTQATTQRGLFLFFVVVLFLLQITFAYTIHGDIGPQFPYSSGLDRSAPEAVIGHIDTILAYKSEKESRRIHPRPESAPAAASRAMIEKCEVFPALKGCNGVPANSPCRIDLMPDATGRYVVYTINRGDTLESISKKLYGNTRMVVHIVRINRIQNERSLKQGERLLLPRTGLLYTVPTNSTNSINNTN